jgi:protein SCO1/2
MKHGFTLLFSCVVAAGIAAFWAQTDGFRVVTSEGARRLDLARAPRSMPTVVLTDQDGTAFSLADYRGRVVLVDFIYTGCPMICGLLGDEFRQIQDLLRPDGEPRRISLLSISFDVAHDGPPQLNSYGERFGAKPPLWRIAVPASTELKVLLDSFGVVVIPDGWGGFTHNVGIGVVDRHGRLVRILDPEPAPRLLARLPSLDL